MLRDEPRDTEDQVVTPQDFTRTSCTSLLNYGAKGLFSPPTCMMLLMIHTRSSHQVDRTMKIMRRASVLRMTGLTRTLTDITKQNLAKKNLLIRKLCDEIDESPIQPDMQCHPYIACVFKYLLNMS